MDTISIQQINRAMDQFTVASEKDIKKLMRRFQKKQEPLLVYTAAVARREELKEAEYELFMNTVLVLWKVTSEACSEQQMITLEQLDEADNALIHEMQTTIDEREEALVGKARDRVIAMEVSRQPILVDFLVEKVIENEDDEVREEMRGMIFLYLNNILDLLLRVSKSN